MQTTDEEVTERYHELIKRYPPDRNPARFAQLRAAYEQVKTHRQRIRSQLFQFPEPNDTSDEPAPMTIKPPRKRLSVKALQQVLEEIWTPDC
jgi:curved DNA-binding protein CbpA